MKRILILFLLLGTVNLGYAQYNKEKLTDVLTGGSTKSWTAKAGDTFTFSKDMSGSVKKGGAPQNVKWSLNSTDNIRWFIMIGKDNYEIIVSYDKAGKQFIKITPKAAGGKPGSEIVLYPA